MPTRAITVLFSLISAIIFNNDTRTGNRRRFVISGTVRLSIGCYDPDCARPLWRRR